MLLAKADFERPDFSRINLYLSASFLIDTLKTSVYNIYTQWHYIDTYNYCKEEYRRIWLMKGMKFNADTLY